MDKTKQKKKVEYLSKTGLRERGWTESMIKKFLGKPDDERTNPHYKCAPSVKLYLLKRVEKIEAKEEFQKAIEKSKIRSEKMRQVAENKRDEILEYVLDLDIEIPVYGKEELYQKACWSYNNFHDLRDNDYTPATLNSDKEFLNRITINYLRHNCTIYENELEKMFGCVGVQEAHNLLQTKINDAIKETYPFLK